MDSLSYLTLHQTGGSPKDVEEALKALSQTGFSLAFIDFDFSEASEEGKAKIANEFDAFLETDTSHFSEEQLEQHNFWVQQQENTKHGGLLFCRRFEGQTFDPENGQVLRLLCPASESPSSEIEQLPYAMPRQNLRRGYDKIVRAVVKAFVQWFELLEPFFPPELPEIHPDPFIDKAVRFYGDAFDSETPWDHNELQKEGSAQWTKVSEWLDLPIKKDTDDAKLDTETPKSLMVFEGMESEGHKLLRPIIWKPMAYFPHRRTRGLSGLALKALFRNLDIKIKNMAEIQDQAIYRMPCTPCLPFFVSLKSILFQMNEEKRMPEVSFVRIPDSEHKLHIYMISLEIDLGSAIGRETRWGLAESYWSGNWKGDPDNICQQLDALTKAQVRKDEFIEPVGGWPLWLDVFTKGSQIFDQHQAAKGEDFNAQLLEYVPAPAVQLEFGPGWVHIIWTTRNAR